MSTIEERVADLETDLATLSSTAVRAGSVTSLLDVQDTAITALELRIAALESTVLAIKAQITSQGLQIANRDGYRHTQSVAAVSWTIEHNLGQRLVLVQVYNSSYQLISPSSIVLTDTNTVTVTLGAAAVGYAIVARL